MMSLCSLVISELQQQILHAGPIALAVVLDTLHLHNFASLTLPDTNDNVALNFSSLDYVLMC